MFLKDFIHKAINMRPNVTYAIFNVYDDMIVVNNVYFRVYDGDDRGLRIGLFDGYTGEKLTDSDNLIQSLLNKSCYVVKGEY